MTAHQPVVARIRHALAVLVLTSGAVVGVAGTVPSASAAPSDELVVVDVNDASTSDFSAASLKTINANGTKSFASPVDLPSADAAPANAFALAGSASGNGSLARSADGTYLAVAGYNHAPGATGQVKSSVAVKPKDTKTATSADGPGIQRMVARVGDTGSVDTSTLLGTTSLDKSHPRGVATENGTSFYVSGNGGTTDTGVFTVPLGGGTKTPVAGSVAGEATADQKNTRNIQIAGGDLYTISEKANLAGLGRIGTGLPTTKSAITRLGPKSATVDLPVPTAVVMLDASATVAGIDVAYLSVDTDDNGVNDEIRKYTSDGTTWATAGTKTGDYPFITGRVNDGTVQIFASKGSGAGNSVVRIDDANAAGPAAFGSDTTVATAAAGHAFRGLAFAPTGWNPGTISSDKPTASVAHAKVGGTVGDSHNPGTTLSLADDDTDAADLTVSVLSSDSAVIPDSGVGITGTGLDRGVSFAPTGVGRATITFTVTDDNNNVGTTQVSYAASAAPASASGRYLYESADLSSAVDVGDGYALAVSSEDNKIRLYQKSESGRPVKEFDFDGDIGSVNADLESMARSDNTLYVLGSHGNSSKDGALKPARDVMFTATIAGSGSDTTLTFLAKRTGLRDDIKAWDVSNGNALGFAAGQAAGKLANDPAGFNIEGFEMAPGSTTTGYLGFRAPLKNGKAVVVPITNLNPMLTGTPTFGDAVLLDLGGRTIRDIRKNTDDEYLISAQDGSLNPEWKLFAWDGDRNHKPVAVRNLPAPDSHRTGAWESIVSVPHPLDAGGTVTLITDSGDTTYYGNATVGSEESKGLRKSYVDEFTTSGFTGYPEVFAAPSDLRSTSTTSSSVALAWTKVPEATGYVISSGVGDGPRTNKTVGDESMATVTGLSASTEYTFTIKAVKSDGTQSPASEPLKVTTSAAPADRPSNVHWTSRTTSAITVEWTKKAGSAKYKIRYTPSGTTTYKYLTVGNVSSGTITGLTRGNSYNIKVAAISSSGTVSPYSDPALTASTSSLKAPTSFVKKSATTTSITLTWTKATGAEAYRVAYGIGTGARTYVDVDGGGTETVRITGLQPGKSYTLAIASTELDGTSRSSYTPRITVTTPKS